MKPIHELYSFINGCIAILKDEWVSPEKEKFTLKKFHGVEIEINSKQKKSIISYPELTKLAINKSSDKMTRAMSDWFEEYLQSKFKINFKWERKEFYKGGVLIRKIRSGKGLTHFDNFGVKKIYPSLPQKEIKDLMKNCKRIRICDTTLPDWLVPLIKKFVNGKKGEIELFLLHPESEVCDLRSKSLGDKTLNEVRNNVLSNLNNLSVLENSLDNLKIYLIKEIPTLNAYKFDDIIWMGQYPFNVNSESAPYFQIESGPNVLSPVINKQFSDLKDCHKNISIVKELKDIIEFSEEVSTLRSTTRFLSMVGTYKIFYTEELTKDEELKRSKIIRPIGVNVLDIKQIRGEYIAKMKTPHDLVGQRPFSGKIELDTGKSSLLVINLRAKDGYANFIFEHSGNAIIGEPTFGSYNISYYRKNGNGVGAAILIKVKEKYDDLNPSSFNPLVEDQILHKKLSAYLLFRQKSVLKPILKRDLLPRDNKFAGTYIIYTNNKKDGKRFISSAVIKVFPNNYVIHKHRRDEGDGDSEGYAQVIGGTLQIQYFNKSRDLNSFYILETLDNFPKEDRIYTGIFSGVSFRDNKKPIAKRVVCQYTIQDFNKIEPQKSDFSTDQINLIPIEIQNALSGKTGNTIGFFRYNSLLTLDNLKEENSREVDFEEVFFDSALMNAHKGKIDKCIKMLKRSLAHSTTRKSLEKFSEALEKQDLIAKENAKKIIDHERYLDLFKDDKNN